MTLYPLRLKPLYRHYLWGGRRLETVLGKQLPDDRDTAESWEVVDHDDGQSVVAAGPLAGASLHELVTAHGPELLGRHDPQARFPLLFKFLDAQQVLSVQVHPNDEQGATLDPPDLGKTEAWVVLHAERGSVIYAGLKRGFDRHALERELMRGTVELCLHRFEPRVGDCVFIPAGTVHALGAGLVIAEIQQASNTTFRLHDWKRVGPDGQPRPLHIVESLEVIDFERGPVAPQVPAPTDEPGVARLVACDKFVLDRREFTEPRRVGGDERFRILAVIEGSVDVEGDESGLLLSQGETMLLPACCEATVTPRGSTVMLEMYLP